TGENCEFGPGTCVPNMYPPYDCKCPDNFRGQQCQYPADPCAGVACENNASCKAVLDNTRGVCDCPDEWKGKKCEEPVESGEPNHCSVGCCGKGHCIELKESFTCVCPPGKTGDKCRESLNPCSPNMCQNGGSCKATDDRLTSYCRCTAGFSG
ncbi:hypothetical protein PFISCL1PPCAC_11654, partial [Pristionchus fissidentatus]